MEKFSDKVRAARLIAAKKRLQNYTVKGRWSKDETYNEGDVVVMADGLYKAVCKSKGNQSDFVSLDTLVPQDGKDGRDAEQVELSIVDGEVSWRRGQGNWTALISVDKLVGEAGRDGRNGQDGKDGKPGKNGKDGEKGDPGKDGKDGREVELRATKTHIQWRLEGTGWKNLVALADLKGERGEKGDPGESAYEIWLRNGNRGTEQDFLASLRSKQVILGRGGGSVGIESIVAGTNVTIDNTDPKNPVISATGGVTEVPYYQYIYNSSGSQTGNRYNSWSDLITAIDGREAIVQFEQNEVLPTGNWNIDYHIWRGNGQNPDGGGLVIEFPEGCYIDSALNWQIQNGMNLYSSSTTHPTYTMTVPHIIFLDRTAMYTDDIEFVRFTGAGLCGFGCANGFGIYNNGTTLGNYEVLNVDGAAYAAILVVTESGIAPTVQNNTVRSTVPVVYGWLKQTSEAQSGFATQANIDAGSIDFTGTGGSLFSNASVVGFLTGQPTGISASNVADALAELVTNGVTQVVHGSDNTVARPTGWKMVIWIGSVEPDNIATNDLWINNS